MASYYILPPLLEIDDRILRRGIIRPSTPKFHISSYRLAYLTISLLLAGGFKSLEMPIVYIITTLIQVLLCLYLFLTHPLTFKSVWKEKGIVKRRQLLKTTPVYRLLQRAVEYATGMNEAERTIYQYKNKNELLVSQLCWMEGVPEETSLRKQVEELKGIKEKFIADRETAFKASEHLRLLQSTWKNLVGSHAPTSENDERWKQLGFQSSQPETDFRAMGIASLRQLEAFSKQSACKDIYNKTVKEHWFPFACVGISITAFINSMLESNCIDVHLARDRNYLSVLYARVWSAFDEEWRAARPADVMHFPLVWQDVKERIEADLCTESSAL